MDTSTTEQEPSAEVADPTLINEPTASDTLSGKPLRDVEDATPRGPEPTGADAVKAAAEGKPLTAMGQADALAWFMSPEADPVNPTKTLRLNFGSDENELWVPWEIQPIEMETMRRIRDSAAKTRKARRTGEIDEYAVNVQIVIAGTVSPPINEAVRELSERHGEAIDPAGYVKHRFHTKPGYITQIAGAIMSLSGFDAEDVQETEAVEAAGNS